MRLGEQIETKINALNQIRNFCIGCMNESNTQYEKQQYLDIVFKIDEIMKNADIEHYVFKVQL